MMENKICPFMSSGTKQVRCTPECELASYVVDKNTLKPMGKCDCLLGDVSTILELLRGKEM